jgi:hypothetical protein
MKHFVIHLRSRPEAHLGYETNAEGGFAQDLEQARICRQESLRRSGKQNQTSSTLLSASILEVDNTKTIHELHRSQISLEETIGQGQYGVVRKAKLVTL